MTIKNYDEFKHEASFAHWDWDVAKARIIIDYYFDNKNNKLEQKKQLI